jgi:hypothetical protein
MVTTELTRANFKQDGGRDTHSKIMNFYIALKVMALKSRWKGAILYNSNYDILENAKLWRW